MRLLRLSITGNGHGHGIMQTIRAKGACPDKGRSPIAQCDVPSAHLFESIAMRVVDHPGERITVLNTTPIHEGDRTLDASSFKLDVMKPVLVLLARDNQKQRSGQKQAFHSTKLHQ